MDAILTEPSPAPGAHTILPRARLPGEDGFEEHGPGPTIDPSGGQAPLSDTAGGPRGRKALLAGAGMALLVAIGGSAYVARTHLPGLLFLHHGTATRSETPIAGNDVALPPPVLPAGTAPGAAIEKPPAPEKPQEIARSGATPAKPAPVARAPAAAGATLPPSPQQAELTEITGLQTTAPGTSGPGDKAASGRPDTAHQGAPTGSVQPAATARQRSLAAPAAAGAPATSPPEKVAEPTVSVPAAHAADPIMTATKLEAAPMAPPQQVELLHLVTEMAVMMRDLRTENGELRTKVQDLTTRVDGQLTQFDQRLSVAEAKGAIAAAMGAGTPDTLPAHMEAPVKSETPPAPPAPPPLVRSVKDYRIQAASPRLAMLNFAGGAESGPSSIQVSIGDDVPGVGRIKSIYQHGSAWVIQTDHGLIQ